MPVNHLEHRKRSILLQTLRYSGMSFTISSMELQDGVKLDEIRIDQRANLEALRSELKS